MEFKEAAALNIRMWCEFLKPHEVCRDFVIDIFKRYGVTLNYKLEYMDLSDDFFRMLETYNDNGIPVSIWATLSDELGYWINEANVDKFGDYVHKIVDILEKGGLKAHGLCIDMEPPYNLVMKLYNPKSIFDKFIFYTTLATKNLNTKKYAHALEGFTEIAEFLRSKGLESYAPITRETYYDVKFGTDFIQNALQTPVFDVPWDKYNLMYYATTMRKSLKGYEMNDVDYLIYRQISHLMEKFGSRVTVSVGVTNIGKLGNEPYYDNMEDFYRDVGVLKACSVDDISIFSLDGILEPSRLEGFIKGALEAAPYIPVQSQRVIDDEKRNKRLMSIAKAYYKMF
jgi:hypothetical protein